MRAVLDPDKTVAETIAPGSDWIQIGESRKHVMSYLADFLFPPRRATAPVKTLSGGERNRLLLARLFAQPANLLVLDEPTNDLDIESLELLEATLQEYGGTLLLVSHDRAFLDSVATQSLVAEGDGLWREYVGGYSDWLVQRAAPSRWTRAEGGGEVSLPAGGIPSPLPSPPAGGEGKKRTKLSFKEQRELDALPEAIETLEREQAELLARISAPDYHTLGARQMKHDVARNDEIEQLLMAKLERWSTLEERAKAAGG
jgi:ATP-binding cassette subfamily F protein uup